MPGAQHTVGDERVAAPARDAHPAPTDSEGLHAGVVCRRVWSTPQLHGFRGTWGTKFDAQKPSNHYHGLGHNHGKASVWFGMNVKRFGSAPVMRSPAAKGSGNVLLALVRTGVMAVNRPKCDLVYIYAIFIAWE